MAEPVCPKCDGTGWMIVEREDVSGAERCDCFFGARIRRLEESANIPELYRNVAFDTLIGSRDRPFVLPNDNEIARRQLGEVYRTVKQFTDKFPYGLNKPGLLLIGEPGTGKTHLAVAALRVLISRERECLFFDYQTLLERIRSSYDPNSNSSDREAYRAVLDVEVLLLDDLGAHRVTDWVEDTVTSIITTRCNNRKALIATTNLPDADAGSVTRIKPPGIDKVEYRTTLTDRIGARARSRLFEMCTVVHMPLIEDFRLRKFQAI